MRSYDDFLVNFISQKANTFFVPNYQRKFKWTVKEEIKCLREDLEEFVSSKERKEYFLGNIVVKKDDRFKFIIVDGQQRITTFLLMCRALYDALASRNEDCSLFMQRILIRFEGDRNNENKIKLSKINDELVANQIISGIPPKEVDKKTNYYKVYKDLKLTFAKKTLEELESFFYEGIEMVKVAIILLDNDEDEFLVYESINSKGQSLSAFDLIKNYFIMCLEKNKVENTWKYEISLFEDKDVNEGDMTDLIRQLLAIETGHLYSKNKELYYKFKNLHPKETINDALCKKLIDDVKIYKFIKKYEFNNYALPLVKSQLMNFYSILHVVFKANTFFYEQGIRVTNQKHLEYAIKYLSRLCIARMLFSFGRVESNRGYASLSNKLRVECSRNEPDFATAFKKIVVDELNSTSTNIRMPKKEEIRDGLNQKNIYENKATLKWTLIAIEQDTTNKQIENHKKIKIQHIFPQKPNADWKSKLEAIQLEQNQALVNTLGNLTITKDGLELGNKLFLTQKNEWAVKPSFEINYDINQAYTWNRDCIRKRAAKLWSQIKTIWWQSSS